MKYQLFISDYDGTLGKAPENNIDAQTLNAINKFIEQGGKFAICSGRETSSIVRICKENGLKGIIVSFQGARISDIETGKYLFEGGLDATTALKVLNDVEQYGLTPLAYSGESFFFDMRTPYIEQYENAIRLRGQRLNVKEKIEKENLSTSKICWLGEDGLVNKVAQIMNEKYKNENVRFNSGAKNLLEAINTACSKGVAVKFLANYYNVPLENVICVGDSTNDIDLITGEWHGVAVGDGREELKTVAKEITVPFDEKPVKYLLEKYCLK